MRYPSHDGVTSFSHSIRDHRAFLRYIIDRFMNVNTTLHGRAFDWGYMKNGIADAGHGCVEYDMYV